jgi:hypothetical protein
MGDISSQISLIQLPVDIIKGILSQWLNLIDISRLDVSISHIHMRKRFLDIISSEGVVYDGSEMDESVKNSYFQWLFMRNISVTTITTGRYVDCSLNLYMREKVCKYLKKVSFTFVYGVCNVDLTSILQRCPVLESFSFCETSQYNVVNKNTIVALTTHCKRLKAFTLISNLNFDAECACALLQGCNTLQELHLHLCYSVDDDTMNCIAKYGENLTTFTLRANHSVTDNGVLTLLQHCNKLEALNLTGTSCISAGSAGFPQLFGTTVAARTLKMLNLSALFINDEALRCVAEHCRSLECLVLCFCNLVTVQGLVPIARECLGLRTLVLQSCQNIDTNVLRQVLSETVQREPSNNIIIIEDYATYFSQQKNVMMYSVNSY